MISAPQVVDLVLAEAARRGRADETIVLVTDRSTASLRWARNTMTTNGESVSRETTVISIVRQGDKARVGAVKSSEVDPAGPRPPVATMANPLVSVMPISVASAVSASARPTTRS